MQLKKFKNNTDLKCIVHTFESKSGIKKDFSKLEIWHKISQMKFSKDKCKDLYLERSYQMQEWKISNY